MDSRTSSKLVAGLRALLADESGKNVHTMSSIKQDVRALARLVRKEGGGDPVELTNSDLPGIHRFVMGITGFDTYDWVL